LQQIQNSRTRQAKDLTDSIFKNRPPKTRPPKTAARLMERFSGQSATIVADSLAAVGGGGGVTGTDSQSRYTARNLLLAEGS
jgi:hypothetical protein